MTTQSYWMDSAPLPEYSKLSRNLKVDVVVVGGGITGVTAAFLLRRAGHTVALVERERCARVDTGHTTAHLTYVTDIRLRELVKNFGKDHAQAAWDAGRAAMQQIANIVRDEAIACQWREVPGYLHAPIHEDADIDLDALKEDAALADELGFVATYMNEVPLLRCPGVRFANQAKFHPRQYLSGLLRRFSAEGGHVFESTEVTGVEEKPRRVATDSGEIECDFVVIATHVPLMGKTNIVSATLFQSKLSPESSYVVGARLPADSAPEALFWDTSDPYYYLRIDRHGDHDYAIFGGEDHKTGQASNTEERFTRLERILTSVLPATVSHRWSGQVVETNDGLPFIGEIREGQFVATGFAGNGMTFGTLGAMMACDAVTGRKNPWADLFDVTRKKIKGGAWDYIRQNLDYPYYMVRDRLTGAEGTSFDALGPGEGKVLKIDGKRVAAYRDESGHIDCVSSICTHMGCVVHWNSAEKTWDCPCHGSRFKPDGKVWAGPAEEPLKAMDVKMPQSARSSSVE